jgi:hypothetical protein
MHLGYFMEDPQKDMKTFLKEMIEALQYPAGTQVEEERVEGRRLEAVILRPSDPKFNSPAAKILMVLEAKLDRMFYIIYATPPESWNQIRQSFELSSRRLLLVPQG